MGLSVKTDIVGISENCKILLATCDTRCKLKLQLLDNLQLANSSSASHADHHSFPAFAAYVLGQEVEHKNPAPGRDMLDISTARPLRAS